MTAASLEVRPAAIEARGWGWRHAGRRAWAVRGLDLRIDAGERVLLLGPSGAGKSTLIRAIAGVVGGADDGESEGTLTIDGADATATRGRAGLVLQDPDAQVMLSRVGDDIAFGCENLGVTRPQIWARVDAARRAVRLDVPRDRSTSALSGGQKQRLALAGVLAMQPGAVLLDEPTANLDPAGVRDVAAAVDRVVRETGATLVVVEHRVDVWLPLVDRVVVLGPEGLLADGDPATVLDRQGASLAEAGVWVPGHRPGAPRPPAREPGDALLTAHNLAVARVREQVVASGIHAAVRAGEVLALTGPNGVGKSTLGLTLAGLLPPAGGAVTASRELSAGARGPYPIDWRSKQLLTRIGTVFQSPEHQLLATTVRDELSVGLHALGRPGAEIERRVDELLERLRLAPLARANPYTLSGGEKRRLTVAATLASAPRVLVLDEPTFGQDARTWSELVALLATLRDDGAAIVAITHDPDVPPALAARVVELTAGGAVGEGAA